MSYGTATIMMTYIPQICGAAVPQGITITPICGQTGITPVCDPNVTSIPVICGGAAAAPQGITITPICGQTGITPVCDPKVTSIPVICGGAAAAPQGITITPICGQTGITPICDHNVTNVPVICGGAAAAPQAVGCAQATVHPTITTLPMCAPTVQVCPAPTAPAPGGCSGIQGGCQSPLTHPPCSGVQTQCCPQAGAPQGITALGLCDKTFIPAVCGVTVASQAIGCTGVPVICNGGAAAAPQAVGGANAALHPTLTAMGKCGGQTVQVCQTMFTQPVTHCSGVQTQCCAPAPGGAAPQGITVLGICGVTLPIVCPVATISQLAQCTGVAAICNNGAVAAPQTLTINTTVMTHPAFCPQHPTMTTTVQPTFACGQGMAAAAPQAVGMHTAATLCTQPAVCAGTTMATVCTQIGCNGGAVAAPQGGPIQTWFHTCGVPPVTLTCPNPAPGGGAAAPQAVTGTINPVVCAASNVIGCTGIPVVC
ncbi:hypothetical protein SAMN05421759_11118 [Roseivivax lentus]|uniref:Uncharacterized protein n=1 Tax=Roseivivax lentus TaxID=633194 RepID=A0A1N7NY13_9RHOB|nr:hypothetical protein [Roseivivax lentus]SIT03223.1 hypothetical protein SAMN05421759_11118 [Roseivivax lentus]